MVGFHVLGPNAGEITQGWTVGMKLKATKHDFDNSIGIHPTCAEVGGVVVLERWVCCCGGRLRGFRWIYDCGF